MISPDKEHFLQSIRNNAVLPLSAEIPYALPYALYETVASKNSLLFESIKGPSKISRYSFIGLNPCMVFMIKNSIVEIQAEHTKTVSSAKPLRILKNAMSVYKQTPRKDLPPFQGGLAGLISYDFVQYFEQLPKTAHDDLGLPDAHFLLLDSIIAFDHLLNKCWIIVCPGVQSSLEPGSRTDWSEGYDEAALKIMNIKEHLEKHASVIHYRNSFIKRGVSQKIEIIHEMKKTEYLSMVRRAKEYIASGDIFQANLSQRVAAQTSRKSPWRLYEVLREINPSPFAAFLDFGYYQIVSSSPERLIRVCGNTVETRPIAGTRPRGRDQGEDERMRAELLLNEKERAEHVMLIDLERNDLGRVSEYGSIAVDEMMITEDCSHVIHIVSNVIGTLAPGKDCFDSVRATFPGGTITGVPKVRCMEIIDELETVSRGPYTGSIGYIGFSGNMDLNIVIRTFVIKDGVSYVQAGAGIVADSDPEREYAETMKKAEALIKTLEMV